MKSRGPVFRLLAIALAMVGFLMAGLVGAMARESAVEDESTPVNERCLRCHGMKTLSYKDETTGKVVSLSVDAEKFATSNHSRMSCINCHEGEYREYPHANTGDRQRITCLGCHKPGNKKSRFRVSNFNEIGRQFNRSVHFKALPDAFDCFSCHDPHVFEVKSDITTENNAIRADNSVCLECHDYEARFSALTTRAFPNLKLSHEWLPSPTMHWRTVRCVECHTPRGWNDISHEIVRGEAVERNCVTCHSKDSALLSRLYKHRAKEERQMSGYINGMLNNDAYIIGMTRSAAVDTLSVVLVGATLAGIGGHALLRWRASRRKRS